MILKLSILFVISVIVVTASFISYKNQQTSPITLKEDPFITQTSKPPKIGLQVGHWKNYELPEELKKLRENHGAEGGGKKEWEVNYKIAEILKNKLEEKGFLVELIPATVPPNYQADAFISIHADSHSDNTKNGFKASTSWYTKTQKSEELLNFISNEYLKHTKLPWENTITPGMKGYYSFNWTKFKHAVNPQTPSIIVENGFLTNEKDQKFLIETPEIAAEGLARGIERFFKRQPS